MQKTNQKMILVSSDYSQFRKFATNRELNKTNVKNIKESIAKHDLTPHFPILVNESMEILDGQNRFEACKQLGKPIYYTVKKSEESDDDSVVALNRFQMNWKLEDYISHFINKGVVVFEEFKDFKDSHKYLSSSQAVTLFSNGKCKIEDVRRGKLVKDNTLWSVVDELVAIANTIDDPENGSTIKIKFSTKCFNGLILALRQAKTLNFKKTTKNNWAKKLQYATRTFHYDGEQYYARWFMEVMKKHGVLFN